MKGTEGKIMTVAQENFSHVAISIEQEIYARTFKTADSYSITSRISPLQYSGFASSILTRTNLFAISFS